MILQYLKLSNYNTLVATIFIILAQLFFGCSQEKAKIDLENISETEDVLVHIDTDYGRMTAVLYDKTPLHKQNFLKLANDGFYDGLLFHRVIEGFMIQGGDPLSRNASKDDVLGRGDPGNAIKAEFDSTLFHKKGVLSAARKPDQINPEKRSNGSQFFIVHGKKFTEQELLSSLIDYRKLYVYFDSVMRGDGFNEMKTNFAALQTEGNREDIRNFVVNAKDTIEQHYGIELDNIMLESHKEVYKTIGGYPSLDGAYSAFGEVVEGLEIIDRLAVVKTGKGDRPLEDLSMDVSLEVKSKNEIEKKYGYDYP